VELPNQQELNLKQECATTTTSSATTSTTTTECPFDGLGRSSSERSSGDGEESLYATIRRKKSLQRNQILAEDDQLCAELRLKTQPQPFIPELRNSLESEKQDLDGFAVSDSKENNFNMEEAQGEQLVKPSDIRKFVRSNSKHKIELK